MKSRYLLTALLALAAPLVACDSDKLLDVTSPTQVSNDIFWAQESDAVLWLSGTYTQLPSVNFVVELDGSTDNGFYGRLFEIQGRYADGSFDSQNTWARDHWVRYYNGVVRTNTLLANIDRIPAARIDAARKARYVAEARHLRAVFYLQLVGLFGNIPLILTPLTAAEALEVTNSTPAQVYDQIIADLDAAAAVLPVSYTGADVGRATRGAALAYKARAALWAGRNQLAADAAKAVIDLNRYSLHPVYADLFLYAGETSPERIFTRNYAKNTEAIGQTSNVFSEFASPANSSASRITPTRALVDFYRMRDGLPITTSPLYNPQPWFPGVVGKTMYDDRDPRMAATILYPGAPWDGIVFDSRPRVGSGPPANTRPEGINNSDFNISTTGYNLRKWIDLKDRADRGNGGVDVILMRYADVLLMYAEAKLALGQPDATALLAINQVRRRAGMPDLTTLTMDDIRYERRVELAFEGLRLFDIRRWKIAEQVMPVAAVTGIDYINAAGAKVTIAVPSSARTFPARAYLWPIPQSEIDLNPNLKQNPGF